MVTSMNDIDITDTCEAPEFFDIPNYDYTSEIPPIEGTTDPRADWAAYLDELDQDGCECEIDWRCGYCQKKGVGDGLLHAIDLWSVRHLANAPYYGGIE